MPGLKVVRSICLFTDRPSRRSLHRLAGLSERLQSAGFSVQTQRLCSPDVDRIFELDQHIDGGVLLSVGQVPWDRWEHILDRFFEARNVNFNLDLSAETIDQSHVRPLAEVIARRPAKTFSFTYTFNNSPSSPFFPSATYERNGFAIGLQPTDLSEGAGTVDEWLDRVRDAWHEIDRLMATRDDYIGVDTSIAPLFAGRSSFVSLIKRLGLDFDRAATTGLFIRITSFINAERMKRVGLCGLMFPCLEDFELADEYEKGGFSVERCLFLSLQSGLGLDSYPVGVDEEHARIAEVLTMSQGLANKYRKPLSARFISDGKARIGERTSFGSPYLKDVTIRAL